MGHKLKIAGWVSIGIVAGALTTVSLQTVARGTFGPLPLEEMQQLAALRAIMEGLRSSASTRGSAPRELSSATYVGV